MPVTNLCFQISLLQAKDRPVGQLHKSGCLDHPYSWSSNSSLLAGPDRGGWGGFGMGCIQVKLAVARRRARGPTSRLLNGCHPKFKNMSGSSKGSRVRSISELLFRGGWRWWGSELFQSCRVPYRSNCKKIPGQLWKLKLPWRGE